LKPDPGLPRLLNDLVAIDLILARLLGFGLIR
jgi:hypothetical protein